MFVYHLGLAWPEPAIRWLLVTVIWGLGPILYVLVSDGRMF